MEIKYNIKKVVEEQRTVKIENEEFICVEHRIDGKTMHTAFIGKGEGNNEKRKITISTGGEILEIHRMYGSALMNAESLLKRDEFNSIISNDLFLKEYEEQKEYLLF